MSHCVICIKFYKDQYFQHLALAGLKLYPCIELQELKGTATNASQDCLFPGKNFNEEPLEYKLDLLPCSWWELKCLKYLIEELYGCKVLLLLQMYYTGIIFIIILFGFINIYYLFWPVTELFIKALGQDSVKITVFWNMCSLVEIY